MAGLTGEAEDDGCSGRRGENDAVVLVLAGDDTTVSSTAVED